MIAIMLKDADLMYQNDGQALKAKYGVDERQTVYSWYQALAAMEKDMTKAGQFEQAKFVKNCMSKAVEPAYNYYGG
jgi:phosphomannomutase